MSKTALKSVKNNLNKVIFCGFILLTFVVGYYALPIVKEATNVYSKGGKQNIWDDELSPLSLEKLKEIYQKAKEEGDDEMLARLKKEAKRRGRKQGKNKLSLD